MIAIFPPPITELLDRANDFYQKNAEPEDLLPSLQGAREFHESSKGFFSFFNKSRVEDEEVKHLSEAFMEHCKKLDENFDKLEKFVETGKTDILLEAVLGVQEASHNMTLINGKLKELKENFEVMAALPVVDDFIRVGINVFNEVFAKEALEEKMPFQVLLIQNIENDINKFKENYPDTKELQEKLFTSLEQMKSGFGAVQSYLDNGDKKDLLNGLNILGVISWELCDHLDAMGIYMGEKGESEDLFVSELLIALEKLNRDDIDIEKFKEYLQEFKEYFLNLCNEIGAFQNDFIVRRKVVEAFIPRLNEKVEDINSLFEELLGSTEETDEEDKEVDEEDKEADAEVDTEPDKEQVGKIVKKLRVDFEELLDLKDEFYDAVLEEKDLSKEPEMIEARNIIKGLFDRVIPVSLLQEKLLIMAGQNEARLERADKCLSSTEAEKVKSLKEPLLKREKAFQLLQAYVSERNPHYLFEALEIIEETYDDLAGVDGLLAEMEVSKNMIACFKCAHMNQRGSKMCSKCGAKFPFSNIMQASSTMEVEEKGISKEGEEEKKYSDDVIFLKGVIEEVCQGRNKKEELGKVLEDIKKKIGEGKKGFSDFTKPYFEKYPDEKEFKEKSEELTGIFEDLEDSLKYIEKYFSEENIDYLKNGLHSFLEGADDMNALDKEIEEMLKKKEEELKKEKKKKK